MNSVGVTFEFRDIEPGWSCINFSHPPRLSKSRTHSLLRSLETFRANNPMRRIEQVQVVENNGIVRGLIVLWSIFEHLQEQSKIEHCSIDQEVRDLYGSEYCEALMEDALGFASENPIPGVNALLVSRRMVAIVMVRRSAQARVTTFEKFLASIENGLAEELRTKFDEWQSHNDQGYFCAVLPDDYVV